MSKNMRLILGEGIELETLTYKLEEKKPKKQKLKREYRRAYLFGLAFTASIGSFVYGYAAVNVSIMSAIISEAYNYSQYIKDNEFVFSGILDTMYYLGGFISSIIAGHYAIFGRRKLMYIAGLIMFPGVVFRCISSYYTLLLAEFFSGLSTGIYSLIVPMLIREVAPWEISGGLINLHSFGIVIGIATADTIGLSLPKKPGSNIEYHVGWRVINCIILVYPIIQAFLFYYYYRLETPKYYLQKNDKENMEFVLGLIYYRGERIRKEMKELEWQPGQVSWKELFSVGYRKALIIGCLFMILRELTGHSVIDSLGINILKVQELSRQSAICIVSWAIVVVTLITFTLIDRIGRKKLLIAGSCVMTFCLLFIGIYVSAAGENSIPIALSTILLMIFPLAFAFSYGPVAWVYVSEILPEKGFSVALGFYWICHLPIIWTYQYFKSDTDNHIISLLFGSLCLIGLFYSIFVVKETKNMTEGEIRRLFRPKNYIDEDEALLDVETVRFSRVKAIQAEDD